MTVDEAKTKYQNQFTNTLAAQVAIKKRLGLVEETGFNKLLYANLGNQHEE